MTPPLSLACFEQASTGPGGYCILTLSLACFELICDKGEGSYTITLSLACFELERLKYENRELLLVLLVLNTRTGWRCTTTSTLSLACFELLVQRKNLATAPTPLSLACFELGYKRYLWFKTLLVLLVLNKMRGTVNYMVDATS